MQKRCNASKQTKQKQTKTADERKRTRERKKELEKKTTEIRPDDNIRLENSWNLF